jgi:endonuclease/exonuclease/phosphatase (EEP) superfamily protein YafD
MRRLAFAAAAVLALVLALPGAALTLLRLIPWDIGTPWLQLLSAFPATLVLTAIALVCVLPAALHHPRTGRLVVAGLVTAVLAVQVGFVAPRVLGADLPGTEFARVERAGVELAGAVWEPGRQSGTALTVMALNVGSSGVDTEALLAEARQRNVDVLALPELAPPGLEALDAAGLASVFPHRVLDVDWAGTGSALFARFPLERRERVPGSVFYQSRATADVPGSGARVSFTAVHVDSPRPGHTPRWRAELQQLGALHAGLPDGGASILLGDFNASADHREFRDLLGTGLTDAAEAAGKGLTPTWPVDSPAPPFVTLDHILVSRHVTVAGFERVLVPGTDHAAVMARLLVP